VANTKKGFTLIELLVVIAIIAILAAILFPVFARTKEKARQAACSNNIKQLATAFAMYRTDYDGKMPRMAYLPWNSNKAVRWIHAIYPSVNNMQIFECPSNEVARDLADPSRPYPACDLPETSYLYSLGCVADNRALGTGGWVIFGETEVKDASNTIILMDGWYWMGVQAANSWNYAMFYYAGMGGAIEYEFASWVNGQVTGGYGVASVLDRMRRHNERVNAAYFDGHAKSIPNARPQDFSPELD